MDLRGEGRMGEDSIEMTLKNQWSRWDLLGENAYREEPRTEPLGPPTRGDSAAGGEGLGNWMQCPRNQEETMFQERE